MVVSTDKSMAVLTHQTTGTGKCWKPGQAMALNEKRQFVHIGVYFGRIFVLKGSLPLHRMFVLVSIEFLYPAVSTFTRVRIM